MNNSVGYKIIGNATAGHEVMDASVHFQQTQPHSRAWESTTPRQQQTWQWANRQLRSTRQQTNSNLPTITAKKLVASQTTKREQTIAKMVSAAERVQNMATEYARDPTDATLV